MAMRLKARFPVHISPCNIHYVFVFFRTLSGETDLHRWLWRQFFHGQSCLHDRRPQARTYVLLWRGRMQHCEPTNTQYPLILCITSRFDFADAKMRRKRRSDTISITVLLYILPIFSQLLLQCVLLSLSVLFWELNSRCSICARCIITFF